MPLLSRSVMWGMTNWLVCWASLRTLSLRVLARIVDRREDLAVRGAEPVDEDLVEPVAGRVAHLAEPELLVAVRLVGQVDVELLRDRAVQGVEGDVLGG